LETGRDGCGGWRAWESLRGGIFCLVGRLFAAGSGNTSSRVGPRRRTATPHRPKSLRRRHIDPTTCDRDYAPEEVEFMRALETYKRSSGRMFPTCSEILEVVRSLGYVRPTA
jgi:hypothetical protein